jgi:hypothetical protein
MAILTQESYKELLKVFGSLTGNNDFKDLDMKEGIIRSSTNNGTLYHIDLTALVRDMDLRFGDLKGKCDILNIFKASQSVELAPQDDGSIVVKDETSFIAISPVIYELLYNKFIDADPDGIFTNSTEVLKSTITEDIAKRFSSLAKSFNQIFIKAKFEGKECKLHIKSSSAEYDAIVCKIPTSVELNTEVDLPSTLFDFSYDFDTNDAIDLYMALSADGKTLNVRTTGAAGSHSNVKLYARTKIK